MSTRTIARAMTTGRGPSVWAIERGSRRSPRRLYNPGVHERRLWHEHHRPGLCGRRVERPQLLLDELPLLRMLSMHSSVLSGMVNGRRQRAALGRGRSRRLGRRRRRGLRDWRRVRGRRLGEGGSAEPAARTATTPIPNPTFTADATTPIPNPTFTADPRCTILRSTSGLLGLNFTSRRTQPWRPPGSCGIGGGWIQTRDLGLMRSGALTDWADRPSQARLRPPNR